MATLKQLRDQAIELGIESKGMKKPELEQAIEDARSGATRRAGVGTVADTLDGAEVVERKDGGESFQTIADDLGVSLAVVMTAYVRETDGDLPATPKAVAKARSEGAGWRVIAARAGITKQAAKALFEESGAEDEVGRGRRTGRAAARDADDAPAKKAPAKKATAKAKGKAAPAAKKATKKTTKKTTAKKGRGRKAAMPDWATADEDDIRAAIEGKTVTTPKGEFAVEEVLRLGKNKAGKRVVQVQTDEGKSNLVLEAITAVA